MSKLKDVAELSGVSLGTVDRIIHNRGRFSDETARRVKEAMLKLNYKPDIRARNLSLSRKCHIAVIMPFTDSNSGYWNLPYQGIQKALKELSASHVSADFHLFNENDRKDLSKTLKTIKGKTYDAYIAAPLLSDEFINFFDKIFKTKPVVFFDSDIENSERSSYIGQKSKEAGQLAAKLLNYHHVDENKKVLIITTCSHNVHLCERVNGFIEKTKHQFEVIELSPDDSKNKKMLKAINGRISREFGAIFVTYASSHFAAEIIESNNLKTKVPMIGFDMVPKNIHYLKNGTIDFILTQRPIDQGYLSVMTIYRHIILGHEIIPEQLMPIDIVTQENLMSHLRTADIFKSANDG